MNVYNTDESGIGIVHKPGKVVAEVGTRSVYSVTAAERRKNTHLCVCIWCKFATANDLSQKEVFA